MLDFIKQHDEAVARGEHNYRDPATGYTVMTSLGHEARGACCGCGCRHCPFNHAAVADENLARVAQVPSLLQKQYLRQAECDVLFWSGGKDSYLALRYWEKAFAGTGRDLVLLTTFDVNTRVVAHQDIPFAIIADQARHLRRPLLSVPLTPGVEYLAQTDAGFELLRQSAEIKGLVFGDLHLQQIRDWREQAFAGVVSSLGLRLDFPIWQRPYDELLDELELSGASVTISAAPAGDAGGLLQVGGIFDRVLVEKLPASIDAFGENGEFHTCVGWPVAIPPKTANSRVLKPADHLS